MVYENIPTKSLVQRIENTTSSGIPDIMVILPNRMVFIESKFETKKIRPEQAAFQIKTNSIIKDSLNTCITLAAYPKTSRFVMMRFDTGSITEEGIKCENEVTFSLDKDGFNDFLNYITL
jgi:hypothetical protein